MSYYRDDLAYGDDYRGGPNRWDRSRFDRARSRGPPVREMDSLHFEDDRKSYGPRGFERERDVDVDVRFDRRDDGPRRYYEDDRPRNYYDEYRHHNDRGYASMGRELAPWKDRFEPPQYYEAPTRRTSRPTYVRRQSSWDAFDRRSGPRYGDRDDERDIDIDVRVTNDNRSPEPRFVEREYRYEPRREDDYRDVRIVRERSVHRRAFDDWEYDRRSRPGRAEEEAEEEDVKIEIKEDKDVKRWKKGYTRFPRRLAHKRAIIEFGLPFEEEENSFVLKVALKKEDIDGIIEISKLYKSEDKPKQLEAPPPPEPEPEPQETEIKETITTKVIENPSPEEYSKYGIEPTPSESASNVGESARSLAPPRSEAARSSRSRHTSKHEERHHSHHGSSSSSSTDVEENESSTTTRRRSVHNLALTTPNTRGRWRPGADGVAHPYIPVDTALSVRSYSPGASRDKHRGRSKSAVSFRRDKSRLRSKSRYAAPEREEVVLFSDRETRERSRSRGGEIVLREKKRDIKEEIRRLEEQKRRLEGDRDVGGEIVVEKDRRGRLAQVRKGTERVAYDDDDFDGGVRPRKPSRRLMGAMLDTLT